MKEFTEEVIIKTVTPPVIDLTKVALAGFNVEAAAIGWCPKCNRNESARVFIKNSGKDVAFVLACPACGLRISGFIGSSRFNAWLDKNITRITEKRERTNLPLLKKVLTRKKEALRVLYR